ncbi:MAG: 50S ribosomal protein L32 [Patescibacteria group bacterium]
MVVRLRHKRGHTRNRRSHHALRALNLSKCASCGALLRSHTMCASCGKYRGISVINVADKTTKRHAKRAQKREAARASEAK